MSDSGDDPGDSDDDWTAAAAAWTRRRRTETQTGRRRPRPPPSPSPTAAPAATGAGTGGTDDGTAAVDGAVITGDDTDFSAAAAAWGTRASAATRASRGAAAAARRIGTAPPPLASPRRRPTTTGRADAAAAAPNTFPAASAAPRAGARERPRRHPRPDGAEAPSAGWTTRRTPATASATRDTADLTAAARTPCAASAEADGAGAAAPLAHARRRTTAATAAEVAAAAPDTRDMASVGGRRAELAGAGAAAAAPTHRLATTAPAAAASAADAPTGMVAQRSATASAVDEGATSGDTATTSSDDEEDSDATSVLSQYSTDCALCARHVARGEDGTVCDTRCCRRTVCTGCLPAPSADAPSWWCRVHRRDAPAPRASGAVTQLAAGAGGGSAAASPPVPCGGADSGDLRIVDLPDVIGGQRADAAAHGVARALRHVEGWKHDQDLMDIMDDLAETLAFGPKATATKGVSAVKRFREFVEWLPPRLSRARAVHDTIDITLAAYVNARCGVARNSPWDPPRPQPPSVRGEVAAVVGLLRLADLLPADPKGTIPRTRRTMRKCGCCQKHDASPRAYTFAWELEAAWRIGVDTADPTAVMVWCLCVTAIAFLLRPKYVRSLIPHELRPVRGVWELRWQRDDKGRPVARPPDAPALTWVPESGLPARHPRLTAAAGTMLRRALAIANTAPPRGATEGPMFCRVEVARRPGAAVPKGAVAKPWVPPGGGTPVPTYWWTGSQLSARIIKRHIVRFLTPVVGAARARHRVLSGFRGGGEMELRELGAPLPVRATIGWWKAKLLAAEGAIVTYEGASVEAMAEWTAKLGSTYLRVLAPGVFTTRPPVNLSRSAGVRRSMTNLLHVVRRRMAAVAARRDAAEAAR